MIEVVKPVVAGTLFRSGILSNRIQRFGKRKALILAYHRIAPKSELIDNNVMPGLFISDHAFSLHLRWLSDHFDMVPLSDIVARINRKEEWHRPLCAITLDDGWYDNYEHAFPILKEYRVPATIFIIGSGVGTSQPNAWDLCFEIVQHATLPKYLTGFDELDSTLAGVHGDPTEKARCLIKIMRSLPASDVEEISRRLRDYSYGVGAGTTGHKYAKLSWQNIHEMQKYGIEFGYHSKNHHMLTHVQEEHLQDELECPEEEAKANGVSLSRIFCYPDGQHNERIVGVLKKVGYQGATTLIPGLNDVDTNPFLLRRINVHEGSAGKLSTFLLLINRHC